MENKNQNQYMVSSFDYFDAKIVTSKFHAPARETSRYAINGIFLEFDINGKIRATSTDGHRLHSVQQSGFSDHGKDWFDRNGRSVILPRLRLPSGTNRLAISYETVNSGSGNFSMVGSVAVRYGKKGKLGGLENVGSMDISPIDGNFPPYREVIPKPRVEGYEHLHSLATFRPDYFSNALSFLGDFGQYASAVQSENDRGRPVILIGIPDGDKEGWQYRATAVIMPVAADGLCEEMRTLKPWFEICEPVINA